MASNEICSINVTIKIDFGCELTMINRFSFHINYTSFSGKVQPIRSAHIAGNLYVGHTTEAVNHLEHPIQN